MTNPITRAILFLLKGAERIENSAFTALDRIIDGIDTIHDETREAKNPRKTSLSMEEREKLDIRPGNVLGGAEDHYVHEKEMAAPDLPEEVIATIEEISEDMREKARRW